MKQFWDEGFCTLRTFYKRDNAQTIPVILNSRNSRKTDVEKPIVATTKGSGSSQQPDRKRSLSRGRGRGSGRGTSRGRGSRNPSVGPPTKLPGATPCPFCNLASCPNPTKCALSYDWASRVAVHARKMLCPQFTCLKGHRERCRKFQTVCCSYCGERHHLAWCRELARKQDEDRHSNTGSEPYEPHE